MAEVKWNVCVPNTENPNRPDEKRYWTRIGVAFEGKKPGSIKIILNAHPIGSDVFLFAREQAPLRDDRPKLPDEAIPDPNHPDDMDIPF